MPIEQLCAVPEVVRLPPPAPQSYLRKASELSVNGAGCRNPAGGCGSHLRPASGPILFHPSKGVGRAECRPLEHEPDSDHDLDVDSDYEPDSDLDLDSDSDLAPTPRPSKGKGRAKPPPKGKARAEPFPDESHHALELGACTISDS